MVGGGGGGGQAVQRGHWALPPPLSPNPPPPTPAGTNRGDEAFIHLGSSDEPTERMSKIPRKERRNDDPIEIEQPSSCTAEA